MKKFTLLVAAILFLVLIPAKSYAAVWYVTPTGAGTLAGTSWANAASDLQLTINNASSGDQIWVVAGTYLPNRRADALGTITMNDRNNAFVLKSGVKIYGGFVGTETLLSQLNWTTNVTTLSGDLGTVGTTTDNAYHVVVSSGAVGTAELNGFTISGGNANTNNSITVNSNPVAASWGGGVFCISSSPILSNLNIQSNAALYKGGGMYNTTSSSPSITGVTLSSNSSGQTGGGICNTSSSSPTLLNVVIASNYALYNGGGMLNESGSNPLITNALIYKNTTTQSGAAIYNNSTNPTLTNATIVYNSAPSGYVGGIFGNAIFNNSIIWGNVGGISASNVSGTYTYSYTLLEGGTLSGTSIISNSNPTFTDISTDNYHLKRTSPVVNKGLNSSNSSSTDLDGNTRIFDSANGGVIDLGAYEYQSNDANTSPFTNGVMYVKKGATGDGTSWTNAVGELSDAISYASGSSFVTQIWVAAGTYYPGYISGNGTTDRDKAFVLPNNIKIYGGFAGTESSVDSRNLKSNPSILSGNLGNLGSTSDNAFHVVISSGSVGTAELNGFTISDGQAINFSNITVNSNTVSSSKGGGIYCISSSPILSNLIIKLNYADYGGGGIYNSSSSPTLTNVLICNNTGQNGSGMTVFSGTPVIVNSTIANNTSTYNAGGIDGSCTVKNSIIWGNNNNNVSGSITYSYTLLQGGTVSSPSIISNSDPKFVNSSSGDFSLMFTSPAKDVGNNSYISGFTTDINGLPRIYNTTVDLGAYEYTPSIRYVTPTGAGTGAGTSWANAASDLQLTINNSSPGDSIWVAAGNYKPIRRADALGTITLNDRNNAFVLKSGVKIYGGFVGTETLLTSRNWTTNVSTLSGDLGAVGTSDNAYHVVVSGGAVGTAELNGFTVTAGNGNGNASSITVNGIPFENDYCGGIYCRSSSPTLTNLIISNNSGKYCGGGMNITYSSPTVTSVTISTNTVTGGGGGGLYIDGTSPALPTFSNCTISSNSAANGGGACFQNACSPTFTNVTFSGNTTPTNGGGIDNQSTGIVTITNSTITGNSATTTSGSGGGIINQSSSPVITNTLIDSNTAYDGAGIYNWATAAVPASPVLTNVSITNNPAGRNGGGICNLGVSGNNVVATLKSCLIAGNTAKWGGGIYNMDYTANTYINTTLANNTVSGSSSAGGAMFNNTANCTETFKNSIIYGNKKGAAVNNIYNNSGVVLTYNYTLLEGGTVSGTTIISNANPLFVNSTSDFHLQAGSPAFEKGSDALYPSYATATDLAGKPRKMGNAIDLGAYEYIVNEWTGITSTDWSTTSNWTANRTPVTPEDVRFNESASNNLILSGSVTTDSIVNKTTKSLLVNGQSLTVQKSIRFASTGRIDATSIGSTITFGGSTAQSITTGIFLNDTPYNLTINNVAGVTVNNDFTVSNLLTINSGKLLTISPATQLNVAGTITNNAGVSGLIIQASSSAANGSLIFHNAYGSPVSATVQMYSKASWDLTANPGNRYHWQYIGIPVRSVITSPTFDGAYVRKWYEFGITSAQRWVQQGNDSVLTSFQGYEICQAAANTYTFQGQLENSDFSSGQLPYTTGAAYSGQSIFANPYTAAIDIRYLKFGAETDSTIYLYNTGTLSDWTTNGGGGSTPGMSSGQYLAIPQLHAGDGLPLVIPSMQGLLIKAKSPSSSATFTIPYSSVITKNTDQQRVNRASDQSFTKQTFTIIDVKGAHSADKLWIYTEPTCTRNFDNGWDAFKLVGSALSSQLYAVEPDGNYQVNTVNDMNNSVLAFQAGEDAEYTLTFTHQNSERYYEKIYLIDLQNNKMTDITESGSTYSFTAESTSSAKNRFNIVTFNCKKDSTTENSNIKITSANGSIFIQNLSSSKGNAMIFDIAGRVIKTAPFCASGVTEVNTGMIPGSYIVKCLTDNENVSKQIIVR
jgi:hypothetical protein